MEEISMMDAVYGVLTAKLKRRVASSKDLENARMMVSKGNPDPDRAATLGKLLDDELDRRLAGEEVSSNDIACARKRAENIARAESTMDFDQKRLQAMAEEKAKSGVLAKIGGKLPPVDTESPDHAVKRL